MSRANGMTHPRAFAAVGLVAGTLFGAGLVLSGMTLPSKVRGFLDFAGAWDPTLVFVMGGAIAVHAVAYRLRAGRSAPRFAERFMIPTRKDLDAKLILGAAIFGLGWGFGGYCPGPAITSLPSGSTSVLAFVVAMLAASFLTGKIEERMAGSAHGTTTAKPASPIASPSSSS